MLQKHVLCLMPYSTPLIMSTRKKGNRWGIFLGFQTSPRWQAWTTRLWIDFIAALIPQGPNGGMPNPLLPPPRSTGRANRPGCRGSVVKHVVCVEVNTGGDSLYSLFAAGGWAEEGPLGQRARERGGGGWGCHLGSEPTTDVLSSPLAFAEEIL